VWLRGREGERGKTSSGLRFLFIDMVSWLFGSVREWVGG
jgi:hypothetical protein